MTESVGDKEKLEGVLDINNPLLIQRLMAVFKPGGGFCYPFEIDKLGDLPDEILVYFLNLLYKESTSGGDLPSAIKKFIRDIGNVNNEEFFKESLRLESEVMTDLFGIRRKFFQLILLKISILLEAFLSFSYIAGWGSVMRQIIRIYITCRRIESNNK